jgi:hypothetical protein
LSRGELVPELHDVGKLVDEEAIASAISGWPQRWKHTFTTRRDEPIDLKALGLPQPCNATWYGVVNHHPERLSNGSRLSDPNVGLWREDPEAAKIAPQLLLLRVADHLASSTSRVLARDAVVSAGRTSTSDTRRCLWSGAGTSKTVSLIRTRDQLVELLTLLSSDPADASGFFDRYGDRLGMIPEDKAFPRNVTTLATHVRLVGQYYRALRRHSSERSAGTRRSLDYAGISAESVTEIEERWVFRIVRCRLRFQAIPARLRDLGVFQRAEAILGDLERDKNTGDLVLFRTFDDLWLFVPREEVLPIRRVLQPLLDAGVEVDARVHEAPLGTLMDGGGVGTGCYLQHDIPAEIAPPLCEVCQLAAGRVWHRRPDDVPEHLCNACRDSRDRYSHRFERLEAWADGDAAWVRVVLDPARLEPHLRGLYGRFLNDGAGASLGPEIGAVPAGAVRTTALAADYVADFAAMLEDFAGALNDAFGSDRLESPQLGRKQLMVLRVRNRGDVMRVVKLFYQAVLARFPGSLADAPFRLAIAVATVHFPFAEHWRLLESATKPVELYLVGTGRLALDLLAIPGVLLLLNDRGTSRRGLHRLADLGRVSEPLARVAVTAREERDVERVASRLATLGLDFTAMRTLAGLVEGRA